MRTKNRIATAAMCAFLAGCASLGDDLFLVNNLSARAKAEALVEEGAVAYRERLVAKGDLAALPEVAKYFDTALRYDPENRDAARYANLVAEFRSVRLRASVKEGGGLLKKPSRSEAENLALALAARRAIDLDASDEEAKALYRATEGVRAELAATFLARVEASMAKAKNEASSAVKERAYLDAFRDAAQVVAIEPRHAKAQRLHGSLRKEVGKIVKARLAGIDPLVQTGAYAEAKAQLGFVKELDAKLSGAFADEVAKAEYALYCRWAERLFADKDYAGADARIKSALAVKRGPEALALQKAVEQKRTELELGATFNQGIANLDRYIAARDLVRAQRVLSGLARQDLDAERKRQLNERRETLRAAVAEVYERGLRAYKAESFKEAIAAFEAVVAVDESYLEVASYLEKARAKQKLLEQF